MNTTSTDLFESLQDALQYMGFTSGMFINETDPVLSLSAPANWPSAISILPLVLGLIGLIFNILSLLIFTASKTFRENSFRCYIYAFVLINCASILTHSWFYLTFYITDPNIFCKYLQYLQQSTGTTSLWIMVLLSFERSFTFTRPFTVKKLIRPRTICLILVVVTSLCFLSHIDEILSVDIKGFRWVNFAYGLCSVNRHLSFSAVRIKIITHLHSFILPFFFNSILDIYICWQICQRRRRLQTKSALFKTILSKQKHHHRSRISLANEITLTLLCQSMWLLITYFPRHLYYLLIQFNIINAHERDNSILSFLIRLNLLIYLAFSPALYVVLSPTLRKEIRSYICLSYQRHRPISLSNISNAQDKFRHFFHSHQQQKNVQHQTEHASVLVMTSEHLPRKIFSQLKTQSKSEPCLLLYQYKKTERSNTIHV